MEISLVFDMQELIIFCILIMGVFITWSTEALGSYIKLVSMSANRNIVGVSLVQAISVISRLGFFSQSFAFAWIIDSRLFIETRINLFVSCLITVLFSLVLLKYKGDKIVKIVFKFYHKIGVIKDLNINDIKVLKLNKKIKPPKLYVFAYLMLYMGSFSPLIIQLANLDFAARSVALSGIINGVSTIMLLSYVDVKFARDLEESELSLIPEELIFARYYAVGILILLSTVFCVYLN